MKKSYLIGALVLTALFTGCTTFPEPQVFKVKEHQELSQNEKYRLMRLTLKKHPIKAPNQRITVKNNCYEGEDNYFDTTTRTPRKVFRKLSWCFVHKKNSITAKYSGVKHEHDYDNYKYVNVHFIKNTENIIPKVPTYFEDEVDAYLSFKSKHLARIEKEKKKIANIKFTTTDSTNILSKKNLETINQLQYGKAPNGYSKIRPQIRYTPIEAYEKQWNNSSYFIEFKNPVNWFGKFMLNYKQEHIKKQPETFPQTIHLDINQVFFDYVPSVILSKNDVLTATLRIFNGNNKRVIISNNSNQFLKINTISIYYNQNIFSTPNINRTIAPQSKQKIPTTLGNDFNRYIKVKNRNQKVTVGIAIQYTEKEGGEEKTLLKLKDFTIKDFEK